MAETTTVNYGWTMPDPGASANTWGATLNATTQKIDAQVKVNETAINAGQAPIGSISMFAGAAAPANWLICDGRLLATTGTYAALFAVIGYTFGGAGANFNLPNFASRFPMGAGTLAATGGEATHVLTAAELAAHAHPIANVTHTHTASQPAHVHPDPGHGHPGSTASDSGHAHTYPGTMAGAGPGGGSALVNAGQSSTNVASANITVNVAAAQSNLQAAGADAVTVNAASTGITTTQNAGGGAAHNNLPPYLQINFIIRYQ